MNARCDIALNSGRVGRMFVLSPANIYPRSAYICMAMLPPVQGHSRGKVAHHANGSDSGHLVPQLYARRRRLVVKGEHPPAHQKSVKPVGLPTRYKPSSVAE